MKPASAILAILALSWICMQAQEAKTPAETPPTQGKTDDKIKALVKEFSDVSQRKTKNFSILSGSPADTNRVAEIAEKIEGHAQALLDWKSPSPESIISLTIIEKESTRACVFGKDMQGNIVCRISGEITGFSDHQLAEILANAIILQYAAINKIKLYGGNDAAPCWLVSAFATEAEITRSAGRYLMLRKRALKAKPLPIKTFLERKFDPEIPLDEQFMQNSFWFYRNLRKDDVFRKKSPKETVETMLIAPGKFTDEKLSESAQNLRWATAFFSVIEKSPAGTESLMEARERFLRMQQFMFVLNGKEQNFSAQSLIKFRASPAVKNAVFDRANLLLNQFQETNPAWFNAFVELGTFLEMLAQPEENSKTKLEGTIWAPQAGTQNKLRETALQEQWKKTENAKALAETLSKEIRATLENAEKKR